MSRKYWLPLLVAAVTAAIAVPLAMVGGGHRNNDIATLQASVDPPAPATAPVTFAVYGVTFTPNQALAANASMTATQVWTNLGAPGAIPSDVTSQFGTLSHQASVSGGTTYAYQDKPVWAFSRAVACGEARAPGYTGPLPSVPAGPACSDWIFADPTNGNQIVELEYDPWLDSQMVPSASPTPTG